MKEIIIPKTLPKYLIKPVAEAIKLGTAFVFDKYGEKTFDDLILWVSPTCSRGMYYVNAKYPHKLFGHTPVARVSCKTRLYLYEKASLGTYKQGVNVGYAIETGCCIVHELTHHAQYKRLGLSPRGYAYGGEVETTANELAFLKQYYPEWYSMIVLEEPKKMKRTKF